MKLTLGDFYRTGIQDCRNAISIDEFEIAAGRKASRTPTEIVDARMSASDWQDPAEWIAQMPAEDYEGLDPMECFQAWRRAWRATAIEIVTAEILRREDEDEIDEHPKCPDVACHDSTCDGGHDEDAYGDVIPAGKDTPS